MQHINLREKLRSGEVVIGSWINSGSPIIAELMASHPFDFLCVDVEHSAVDLPQTQQLFQAIASGNPDCAAFVRLHGVDYSFAKRYMDSGARGVIAPLVRTKEEAELIVEAVKYPPMGNRGVGFCRGNRYGLDLQGEFDRANDVSVVGVQIEHIDAVDNIEEILSVPGVDAAFIGPYDLSASMGLTAQFDHPDYLNARDRILKACQKCGVAAGIHIVPPDTDAVQQAIEEGYQLIAYSLDITIINSNLREAFKTGLKPSNS
jgi:2-dehydro-3-deoxyglucarate aldolase